MPLLLRLPNLRPCGARGGQRRAGNGKSCLRASLGVTTETTTKCTMPKSSSQVKVRAAKRKRNLRDAPEISVFLICRAMVEELRNLAGAFNAQEITRRGFMARCKTVVSQLNEAVAATERFDVVLPVMDFGQFSPFFWRWFNWWDDYLKDLTPGQVAQIEWLASHLKPAADAHRPREHWLRYRQGAAFSLVIL